MESRSTMVRYFSLVSLLSISCISFAAKNSQADKSRLESKVLKAYALGAASGVAGTMAFNNKALIAERSANLLTYFKSLRSAGSVVSPVVAPVVTEVIPAVVTPGRFAGITTSASNLIASAQSGFSSGLTSASNGLASAQSGFVSGLASAKAGMASGLTSVGNGFISAKNTVSAFGSKQLENAGYYGHKALTGSKDCGNAVLAAVINNPKTSGAVVAGTAAVALAVYHRKAIVQKASQFCTGTKNLLVNNAAYFGPLAAVLTVEAGKALLKSDFYAHNSAAATAYFSKQA